MASEQDTNVRLEERFARYLHRHYASHISASIALGATGAVAIVTGPKSVATVGLMGVVFASLLFMMLLVLEAGYMRRRMAALSTFTQNVRDYSVGNIAALRESLDVLKAVDIPEPEAEPSANIGSSATPLGKRERETLLSIIGLLCAEANIDIKRHAKAAATIRNRAELEGIALGETTIEEHLKRVPDAMANKSK